MSCELSVIVPVFNQQANLERFVPALTSVLASRHEEHKIILIDQG